MNKKRLLSIFTLILLVCSLVTMALAAPEAAPVADAASAEPLPWYAALMSSNFGSFLPIIIIFVVFYFLLIRPENKKKKEIAKMRSNLKVGDEITTIGGIMGRVTNVRDDQLTIESSNDRSKLRIAKWAVSTVDKAREVPEDTAE